MVEIVSIDILYKPKIMVSAMFHLNFLVLKFSDIDSLLPLNFLLSFPMKIQPE
jgi:hypothetical protein